jgi:hypothetical protein
LFLFQQTAAREGQQQAEDQKESHAEMEAHRPENVQLHE